MEIFLKLKILLKEFDGVMLGRLIQNNPFLLTKVDKYIFNECINNEINEDCIPPTAANVTWCIMVLDFIAFLFFLKTQYTYY